MLKKKNNNKVKIKNKFQLNKFKIIISLKIFFNISLYYLDMQRNLLKKIIQEYIIIITMLFHNDYSQ